MNTTEQVAHTVGPWELGGLWRDDGSGMRRRTITSEAIGSIADVDNDHDSGEANARLIAASPEILSALLRTTAALVLIIAKRGGRPAENEITVVRQAQEIIAKATGGISESDALLGKLYDLAVSHPIPSDVPEVCGSEQVLHEVENTSFTFTQADAAIAEAEGWSLFDTPRGIEIERDDVAAAFESDEEAIEFCIMKADQGSLTHATALAIHFSALADLLR